MLVRQSYVGHQMVKCWSQGQMLVMRVLNVGKRVTCWLSDSKMLVRRLDVGYQKVKCVSESQMLVIGGLNIGQRVKCWLLKC